MVAFMAKRTTPKPKRKHPRSDAAIPGPIEGYDDPDLKAFRAHQGRERSVRDRKQKRKDQQKAGAVAAIMAMRAK